MIVRVKNSKDFLGTLEPSSDFSLPVRALAVRKNSGFLPEDWGRLTGNTLIFVEEVLFSNEVEAVFLFLHSSYLMMRKDGHCPAKLPLVMVFKKQPCFGFCSLRCLRNAILSVCTME